MSATIKLTDGEERELRLTTASLYRFEKSGGDLNKASEIPVTTMVDLTLAGILRKGEDRDGLIERLPAFSVLLPAVQSALEDAGLGEPKAEEDDGSP